MLEIGAVAFLKQDGYVKIRIKEDQKSGHQVTWKRCPFGTMRYIRLPCYLLRALSLFV